MTPNRLRTLARFHSGTHLVDHMRHAEDCPGMGWHNTGEWDIDHFYPLAAIGRSPDWLDVAAACNYRNLRPLWRSANRSKRATVLPEAKALFDAIRAMLLEGKA